MFVRIYGASTAQTMLVSMQTRSLIEWIKPLLGTLVCPLDVSHIFKYILRQILANLGDLKTLKLLILIFFFPVTMCKFFYCIVNIVCSRCGQYLWFALLPDQ